MFASFAEKGVGLHTGANCRVELKPGPEGKGIVFLSGEIEIPAKPEYLSLEKRRATNFVRHGKRVGTTEHLLAALTAMGEKDVVIRVQGSEIPILDGSARPWVERLIAAGARKKPHFVRVPEHLEIRDGAARIELKPLRRNEIPFYKIRVDYPLIGHQALVFKPTQQDFFSELAPAKTFGFLTEIPHLFKTKLALGGSLGSALVFGDKGAINPEVQSFPDEPVRHKLLDALGDFTLLGGWPWAEVKLIKPSHHLIHELARSTSPLSPLNPPEESYTS